ncbi:MAG TPA: tetratricopeptide repeat protein [Nannocystis sp.]|jgi:tetratricopeptide (TPR) repeat protein
MSLSTRVLALVVLTLAVPACKKSGTNAPGGKGVTVEEQDKKRAAAQQDAKARTLVGLANEDLSKGRWFSARERAKRALEAEPNNADAFAILGAANWRAGDYAASTKAFKEALELDAKNFGAAVGLGRNYQAAGDHKSAIELQDKLLEADPAQFDPLVTKLWSYYALADAANAVKTLDALFKQVDNDNPLRPLLLAHAAFMRPLEGKGELIKVEGARGTSDLQVDPSQGIKHAGGTVGGEFTRIVFFELREEARIHKALADQLKLKELGKITPIAGTETSVVLIPEIKFGDLKLTNVPAIVEDLTPYTVGEVPGVVLGRQVMNKLGAITFDFPNASLELAAAAPAATPAGSSEAPLLLIDMHILLVPVTTVSIDGSDFKFYAWLGGSYGAALAVARKEYLKSGHLPRELEQLDDPTNGLKMVFLEKVKVGETAVSGGVGGLVLANTPPDAGLAQIVEGSSFELGGYINYPLLRTMKVTYAMSQGKVYLSGKTAAPTTTASK